MGTFFWSFAIACRRFTANGLWFTMIHCDYSSPISRIFNASYDSFPNDQSMESNQWNQIAEFRWIFIVLHWRYTFWSVFGKICIFYLRKPKFAHCCDKFYSYRARKFICIFLNKYIISYAFKAFQWNGYSFVCRKSRTWCCTYANWRGENWNFANL